MTCCVGWRSSGQGPLLILFWGGVHKVDISPIMYIYDLLLLLHAGNIYTNYSAADLYGMGKNQDPDPGSKQFLR